MCLNSTYICCIEKQIKIKIMKTIEVSVYKRGVFNFKYSLELKDEKEILSYIKDKETFTQKCIEEENEFGENIYPFAEKFSFNNLHYIFYADA